MPTSVEVIVSDDRHTHVRIVGPLDLSGVEAIELRFTAHTASRRRPAIVDLSEVPVIASLGMGLLTQVSRILALSHAKLVLLKPRPEVAKAIRTARLDIAMAIADDLDDAHGHAGLRES